MAARFGWAVFGPQLRAPFGLGDDDELEPLLAGALVRLASPRASP